MKRNLFVGIVSALVIMATPVSVLAHGKHAKGNKGYLINAKGDVTTSKYGECWKTTAWKKSLSIPFCEGDGDNDGVADPLDKCPNSPPGASVDKNGCSLDADGDGVLDGADKCPTTPPNTPVDAVGCSDLDGDGVNDDKDQCPDTPHGFPVDAVGCPLDSDGDGVLDGNDQCPNTRKGARVDAVGCEIKRMVLENVYFETNSATLTADSTEVLDEVADGLLIGNHSSIVVNGHTDSRGSAAYNEQLSDRRAHSVRSYLIDKGLDADIMSARGYGESDPVESNDTAAGRAKNRRVEIDLKK